MAQKAAKSLATRNSQRLLQTHMITLAIHSTFNFLRWSIIRRAFLPYLLLCLPALALEAYLDVLGRPKYRENGDLQRAGDDLEAKGLTEYMWDIIYWSWINLLLVVLFGDRAWWLYLAVPAYTIYALTKTAGGIRDVFGGMGGGGGEGEVQSKRQQKLEKKGGQRVAYR